MRLYSPLQLRERRDLLQFTVSGKYGALTLVEDGLRADYLVDMDHWRIEKVAGTLTVNGMEMRFLTEYSDFAFQDGVLIHRRENKFAGDVNTAVLQLRRLVPAAELDPERFEPQ